LVIFQRALDEAEIKRLMEEGAEAFLAVAPMDKLTTTWASIKT